MNNIKGELVNYIKNNAGTSFVEIEKCLMKTPLIIKVKEHTQVQ